MSTPQGALLVGSVNLDTAEETFRLAGETLSGKLKRFPDGEVGDRFHWIAFQPGLIAKGSTDFEQVGEHPIPVKHLDMRPIRFVEGADRKNATVPNLAYADAAKESYQVFKQLRTDGVIPSDAKFQASLPTPTAVIGATVIPEDRVDFEPLYVAALKREVQEILAEIPAEDLAIQWDVAVEFAIIEALTNPEIFGGTTTPWWDGNVWEGLIDRAAEQAGLVPEGVELGYHLCYGDVAEAHFVEPKDTTTLVTFANRLSAAVIRQIQWIHLPVPIERDDEAYFEALQNLELHPETELYLGLVHREDGVEGAKRRIETAKKFVDNFGIGTECGIGRAPEGETRGIFETHQELAASW